MSTAAHEGTQVIVIGAGPVGLAAAIGLDEAGYRTVIVAPAASPRDERTSALLSGSVDFLTRLGVWRRAEAAAAPMRSLRIVDATQRLVRAPEVTFHASEIGLEALGYNIPNSALMQALATEVAARGIARRDASVAEVRPEAHAAVAVLSDGGEIAAPLMVGADGRRSRARESLGVEAKEWRYDQAALVVNVRHSRPHEDTSTEFHTEAGPFTLVPLPGRRSSLVWVDRPEQSQRRLEADEDALAAEIEARSSSILGRIAIDGARQVFPLSGMSVSRFAERRVVLVGEAAHLFPPIGAQGLNLGYRDASDLVRILAGPLPDPGAPAQLAAYRAARRRDVALRTRAVDALNRTLLTDLIPVQGLRGLGLFLLDRVAPLRQMVMRQGVGG